MTTSRLHARLDRLGAADAPMRHEEWVEWIEAERQRDPEGFAARAAAVTPEHVAAFFSRKGTDRT